MTEHCRKLVAGFAILLWPLPACALEPGMFLCPSPLIAHNFWGDLAAAQQLGVHVDRTIAAQIAAKDKCEFVRSDSLKPVSAGWGGTLALTDGKVTGWATLEYYVGYTNRPK